MAASEERLMLPARIPKPKKRDDRWRSPAHCKFVREFACAGCGSMTNVIAAHYKIGAHTGTSQKGDDWRTTPLCDGPFSNADGELGCHQVQHAIGEQTFWKRYEQRSGQTVWQLIDELCAASPKRREIADRRKDCGL
jgi:hypothetical protein